MGTISLKDLTPMTITVTAGDLLLSENMEDKLVKEAGADICLLGSYVVWEKIKGSLPENVEEMLDFAKATEAEKEFINKMEAKEQKGFLANLSKRILAKVKSETFDAVDAILKSKDITSEVLNNAEKQMEQAIEITKEQKEKFVLHFREPNEAEVRSLVFKPNEDNSVMIEKISGIMWGCFQDHNVTNGNGQKATNEQIKEIIKKRGMMSTDIATRFQESLPLPKKRRKNSAR